MDRIGVNHSPVFETPPPGALPLGALATIMEEDGR